MANAALSASHGDEKSGRTCPWGGESADDAHLEAAGKDIGADGELDRGAVRQWTIGTVRPASLDARAVDNRRARN
jgi:hypothetical protein